jgi:F-type H+-transporting ATPase subunit b
MVSLDGSIVIQIINFLVVIWALNMVLYKPIRGILMQRQDKVTGLEQNISALSNEAEEQDKAFGIGIREARARGQREKESMLEGATAEEKEILTRINERAQSELAEIKIKIAKEVDTARGVLQNQVGDFAAAITQKILGRAV